MQSFNTPKDNLYSELAYRLQTDSSEAWQVHDQALQMKKCGEDVVILSIGDPDFRTPQPIIDNAVSHMQVGRTHYSPALGELNLRRAVADYESRVSPHQCDIDEVSIYPGVTSGIFTVMSCLLNPGDEVIIVDPMYVGYSPIMDALNVRAKTIVATAKNSFEPQYEDFINAATKDTRLIFINTPGNPTGAIIPKNTLKRLARYCLENRIWLVCDEVYSMFTYEKPHVSLRTAADSLENIVVIDGLSKSHAMSGWRIGWVVAPKPLTVHLGNFSGISIFGCPQFIQDAAAFALNNDEYYVREMCESYHKRRNLVCNLLSEIHNIRYIQPQSGMFIMVDISKYHHCDIEFAKNLLAKEHVSVLPGSAFGSSTSGHIRLSLVQPANILTEGCKRLKNYILSIQ